MNAHSSIAETKRTTRWTKTAGIGAMVGSVAVLAASILDNVTAITSTPATAEYVALWAMFAVGALLLLVGAVAVYTRYSRDYGRLGTVGTALAGLGFLSMTLGGAWSVVYTGSAVASPAGGFAFAGLFAAVLGSLVLAIGLRRASIATRAAVLLIAAPVVLVASFVVSETLAAVVSIDVLWILFLVTFCAGWVALGDALRHSPESGVTTATPVA